MLGLKLNHVSKRGHRNQANSVRTNDISITRNSKTKLFIYCIGLTAYGNPLRNDHLEICYQWCSEATLPTLWFCSSVFHDDVIIFRVTGPLCGEFTGPGEFPAQRPVTRSFDIFFDLRLNKRLSEQPCGQWFEMPLWSLWRHCNVCGHEALFLYTILIGSNL